MAGKIENAIATKNDSQDVQNKSINQIMSAMLEKDAIKKRFDELLGKRSAQFVSSIVSLVNADSNMQQAFYESPMSVIQAGLKAATFDLPVDQNLGYAYIVPFRNKGKMTANFILGWKGMHQLAIRTGAYKTINVVDIREGELKSYNRLTDDIDIDFIDDEDERESKKVIGYVGYYRLVNGAEKTIYMSVKQIENHEKKYRKGEYQGKGWRDDWDAMARKTVYRKLIGKWGVMSIEYQNSKDGQNLADQMKEEFIDNDYAPDAIVVDVSEETGEVTPNDQVNAE